MAKQHANRSNEPLLQANNKTNYEFSGNHGGDYYVYTYRLQGCDSGRVVERYQHFEETCLTGANFKHL